MRPVGMARSVTLTIGFSSCGPELVLSGRKRQSPSRGAQIVVEAVRIGVLTLLIAKIVAGLAFGAGISRDDALVDPEVRALTSAGRARVIVMLQIPETTDHAQRTGAIGRAQEAVLARLPHGHASLVRR